MKLLFDDSLAPITSEMSFFETQLNLLAETFSAWQAKVMAPLGVLPRVKHVSGPLRDVLLELLPFTSPRPRRYLFLPTTSPWIGLIENSSAGTDAGTLASFLSQQLNCRAARVVAVPHTKKSDAGGRYGACILELFGPGGEPRGHLRSIAVVNDGGHWSFTAHGSPLPFENLENYRRRRVAERFTFDDLRDYVTALGLRPFQEDFYRPTDALLVELVGPKPKGMKEYTLEEVRAAF